MKCWAAPQALSGGATRHQAPTSPSVPQKTVVLRPARAQQWPSRRNSASLHPLYSIGQRQQGSSSRRPAAPALPRAAASIDLPLESPVASLSLDGEDAGLGAAVSGAALALWPRWALNLLVYHSQQVRAFWSMARPINILPSFLLVLLGAWTGAGQTVLGLRHAAVWVMGLVSASVSVASCIINDYFDMGVDALNAPSKPLPSGVVTPDGALLLGGGIYVTVLVAACLMAHPGVRLIIAASATATLLYTPVLKRISFIKNATVAATIAAAPLAGALAAGAGRQGLQAVVMPCAFVFLAVMYRELLMDIQDVEGDAEAGVRTLPAIVGAQRALAVGVGLLAGCVGLGAYVACTGTGLAWMWAQHASLEVWVRACGALCLGWTLWKPLEAARQVWRGGFERERIRAAIDDTLKTIGAGMILLAAIA